MVPQVGKRRVHRRLMNKRRIIRELSWDQHPWKGWGGSRSRQREKQGCSAVLRKTQLIPWAAPEQGWSFIIVLRRG